jgi:hypothetical protein
MAERGMMVAARFLDGRVIKGWTENLRPDDSFSLYEKGSTLPTRMSVKELKAVFYIKSLEGNPDHDDSKEFIGPAGVGRKIWIVFTDGEKLAGWSSSYREDKEGFYVYPTDPDSNIDTAYVFRSALKAVLVGEEAECAAAVYEEERKALTTEQEPAPTDENEAADPAPARDPDLRRQFACSPDSWEDFLQSSGF